MYDRSACSSSFGFPFKFSSGVVGRSNCIVRLFGFAQLSWNGQVGWLPSFGFLQGLVVLRVLDSADLKVPLRSACLEG